MRKHLAVRYCLILTISLLVVVSAAGQYRFDMWTTDNGLPQNGVREITQTPDGYLWFTTFDGLVRFDGVRFTTFNKSNTKGIINNRFTGIYVDRKGTLYATTMEDGVLTIRRDGVFTSLTSDQVPGHYISEITENAEGEILCLVEDAERRSKSWYRFRDGQFEFVETRADKFNSGIVINGASGRRWRIDPTGVTESFNGNESFIPLELSSLPYNVSAIEDRDGALWIGENRVHRIRGGELRTFDERDGLPRSSLYHSLWQDADGSIWFSSGGAASSSIGLVQVTGDSLQFWGSEAGLASTSIQSVFVDNEGTPWLATDRGLARRRTQTIESFGVADGLDHTEIYPLLRTRSGDIWIGSSRGLNLYRNGVFEKVELEPPSPDTPLDETWRKGRSSLQALWEAPDGALWAGLNGGIYIIRGRSATNLLKGSHVFAISAGADGSVWAATNKGLLQYRDEQLVRRYGTEDGLPNEFMTVVFNDRRGGLWFGGYGGLSKFENGKFTSYTTREGLAGNYVRTLYEDADGAMWIGTYDQGMSRFKDGVFTTYNESNGLYSNGVFAIEEDANSNFWISSNHGIYRVNRTELNSLADGQIAKINSVGYGKEDGMLSTECNGGRQPASLRDERGRFWFPTQNGVSVVDPAAVTTNARPPSVVIEKVVADREPVDILTGGVIAPGSRDLEIQYTGISLIKSEQIKFQYMLEGHDEGWIDAETRRTAYYSNLPPGEYTFRVRAANSDGVWNETGTSAALSLRPFFYQTWAFIVLCAGLVVLLLFIIWKTSVHRLEARERKLTRLVAARTEELAAANRELQAIANSDGLTKIGNRRRFESFLQDEWHRAIRFRTPISLVMLDIDHFKSFNDTYGHQAGDDCLQAIAEAFARAVNRPTDLVARFGGEEFAIVLGGTDAPGALQIAELAVANVAELAVPHSASPTGRIVTVSAGIATVYATLANSSIDLIRTADDALYLAKANGRNRIEQAGMPDLPNPPVPTLIRDLLDAPPA